MSFGSLRMWHCWLTRSQHLNASTKIWCPRACPENGRRVPLLEPSNTRTPIAVLPIRQSPIKLLQSPASESPLRLSALPARPHAAPQSASLRVRTRRSRPRFNSFFPAAVAWMSVLLPSSALRFFVTSPCSASASTMRVIVGGRTCSAVARSPSATGPANTITDKADKRGAVNPLAASSRRSLRNR